MPRSPSTNGAADRIRTGDVQLGNFPAPSPESSRSLIDQQLAVAHAGRVIPRDGPLYHVASGIVGSKVPAHETLLR